MTRRVLLEPVFVLHQHPYQNSSLLVEFFSRQFGRLTALARSARGPRSRFRGYLQTFSPLLASWSGRRELMNLNQLEWAAAPFQLDGQALMCAFYLNELLLRLLPRDDPYPGIFQDYQMALQGLEKPGNLQAILRRFEKRLLEHLGYGLSFQVEADRYYRWLPEQGFMLCEHGQGEHLFLGRNLLAIQSENWDNSEDLAAAKRLLRLALSWHLGGRPLKSRELFVSK